LGDRVRIAVASGKGGTGKTTVATGLALAAAAAGRDVAYVDCDVEEPNGHIYLKPAIESVVDAATRVPFIDPDACTLCRRCIESCRFGALALAGRNVLTFPELCHACGACGIVCPENAVSEQDRKTGVIESGAAERVRFVGGRLTVGEAMPMSVLRSVIGSVPDVPLAILDAPPGTSCSVVETLSTADLVLLVVEPTPFGLHDFSLAVELVGEMGLSAGVVVNKDDRSGRGQKAAAAAGLTVFASFPEKRVIAELCSRGEHPFLSNEDHARRMRALLDAVIAVGEGDGVT
jgi:MinD superfamily P-loop ATPase